MSRNDLAFIVLRLGALDRAADDGEPDRATASRVLGGME